MSEAKQLIEDMQRLTAVEAWKKNGRPYNKTKAGAPCTSIWESQAWKDRHQR